jgi:UTP-glucose-1-phosphate uridylyltransferase
VFRPHLFDYLERAAKVAQTGEFTDAAVIDLIIAERGLIGMKLRGALFDIGSPADYNTCLRAVSEGVAQSSD